MSSAPPSRQTVSGLKKVTSRRLFAARGKVAAPKFTWTCGQIITKMEPYQTLVAGVARKVRQGHRVLLGQLPEERELAASVSFIQVNSSGTSASSNFLSISKR